MDKEPDEKIEQEELQPETAAEPPPEPEAAAPTPEPAAEAPPLAEAEEPAPVVEASEETPAPAPEAEEPAAAGEPAPAGEAAPPQQPAPAAAAAAPATAAGPATAPAGDRDRRPPDDGETRPRTRRRGRRRICIMCVDKMPFVDYKDFNFLRQFISERGRIDSRRKTGTCAKHQRALAQAIKRARHLALLPYTVEHIRASGVGPLR